MEAAQLLQLNSNSHAVNNSSYQTVESSKSKSSFRKKLNNATTHRKQKQQSERLLNQNDIDSVEDLKQNLSQEELKKFQKLLNEDADSSLSSKELAQLQKLLSEDSDLKLSSAELKKILSEDLDLNLSPKELQKLQKLLAKDGFEITEEELKDLLDSIGSIYQELMELDINQLSSLSKVEKNEFKELKADLLTTVKEFKLQLKNLKEIDAQQFELSQQQSTKEQHQLKATKQLKENLLQKLAELKKLVSKMQKQKSAAGLKSSQQNQQLQQISRLLKQLNNSDSKLNKLLQKYGITGEQLEVDSNKQQAKPETQQLSKEQLESKGDKPPDSSDKSSLNQLLKSQNEETKEEKVKVRLSSDKQKLKAESFNAAKVRADEGQMRAKSNAVKQNIINSKFMNVNGSLQRVDQTKVVDQVLQQLEQLKSLGKNELTLKLKPDFLGKVDLKMAISDGVLTTKIMAENHQVKKAIEAQLHQLKNALTEKDLEVGEMVVEVGSEEDFSSFQEQESFTQQEFSGRQQNRQNQQELDPELLMELGEIEEPIEVDSAVDSSLAVDSIDYVI